MAFLKGLFNKLPFAKKEETIIIREIRPQENHIKVSKNITVKELKEKIVKFFKDTKKHKLSDEDIKNMQLITSDDSNDVGIDVELLKDADKIDKIWNNAITMTPMIDLVFAKCDTNCDNLKSICKSLSTFLKLKEKSPHHLSNICKDNQDMTNAKNSILGGKKKKRRQTKRRRRKKTRKKRK